MVLAFGQVVLMITALEDMRTAKESKLRSSRGMLSGDNALSGKLSNREALILKIASLESQLVEIDRLLTPMKEEAARLSGAPSRIGTEAVTMVR